MLLHRIYWASHCERWPVSVFWVLKRITVHYPNKHHLHVFYFGVWICLHITAAYCSTPDPPVNGSVHSQTGTKLGSTLRFSCDQGFRLIGQSSATCTRTPQGVYQWNAPVPLCQGGLNLFTKSHLILIPWLFIETCSLSVFISLIVIQCLNLSKVQFCCLHLYLRLAWLCMKKQSIDISL